MAARKTRKAKSKKARATRTARKAKPRARKTSTNFPRKMVKCRMKRLPRKKLPT